MAIIFADGFEHYGTDENNATSVGGDLSPWNNLGSTSALSTTNPRTGSFHLRNTNITMSKKMPAGTVMVGLSFWSYISALPGSTNMGVRFGNSPTDPAHRIMVTSSGALTTQDITPSATSADNVIIPATWQHIEIKYVAHQTNGVVEVRVDGVTVINLTNADTLLGSRTDIQGILFQGIVGVTWDIDDVVLWDTTGSVNNDFLGPGKSRVYTVFPTADEAAQDWMPSTGTDGYAMIDEAAPDGDTTHIEAATVGDISEFALGDVAGLTDIAAVVTVLKAKNTGLAAKAQASLLSGASVSAGADRNIGGNYPLYLDVHEVDPATSAAWVPADFNAAKLRLERTA